MSAWTLTGRSGKGVWRSLSAQGAEEGSETIENRELLILVRFAANAGPISRLFTEQSAGKCSSNLPLACTGRARVLGRHSLAGLAVASPATLSPPWHQLTWLGVLPPSHWRTRFRSISTNFTSEVQLSRACALGRHGNRPNVEGVEPCFAVICM